MLPDMNFAHFYTVLDPIPSFGGFFLPIFPFLFVVGLASFPD